MGEIMSSCNTCKDNGYVQIDEQTVFCSCEKGKELANQAAQNQDAPIEKAKEDKHITEKPFDIADSVLDYFGIPHEDEDEND